MPAVAAPAKILVTGANGFIAVWLVKDLLERGYTVKGTVRSESKKGHLLKLFEKEVKEGRLELVVVPDFTVPGAFDEAVRGVDAIEHTASPFHFKVSGVLASLITHDNADIRFLSVTIALSVSAVLKADHPDG